MKIEYWCSNCGKHETTSAMIGICDGMYAAGYRAVGSALYCPECVNTWAERNGREFDKDIKEPEHQFTAWWNERVLAQAEREGKAVKRYRLTPFGYVDGEDI